ncbi:hypothetical protein IFM89_009436 [Coptis chinensis]|uniref:Uncharacterized protein n=1 Tax=Coptis chinensis TaxID=261450 RepID=A0A835I6Y3_9MAGN|nr:hypothetical protein IFM89_009436 [Coptis chinensis]
MIVEVCYINCNGILLTHLNDCRMGQNFSRQVNKVFQILILGASIEILQGLSHSLFLHTYMCVCLLILLYYSVAVSPITERNTGIKLAKSVRSCAQEEIESSYSAKVQQSKNSLSWALMPSGLVAKNRQKEGSQKCIYPSPGTYI